MLNMAAAIKSEITTLVERLADEFEAVCAAVNADPVAVYQNCGIFSVDGDVQWNVYSAFKELDECDEMLGKLC